MEKRTSLIQLGGNCLFMLLILLFLLDPTNTIFNLKNKVFILFFGYNMIFFKPDWGKSVYFIISITVISIACIFAMMRGIHVDFVELKGFYTAFVPLLLLMWIDKYDVIALSRIPVFVTALIVVILFWVIFFIPELEGIIYLYMTEHDDTIMMSNRVFLGMKFFCMYCKSTVAMMPVYGLVLYEAVTKGKRTFFGILLLCVLIHLFLISGTRSSVLLPIALAGMILFVFCRNERYFRYVFYPVMFVVAIAFVVLLTKLLMEENEPSNLVKYAHLTSYKELFTENTLYIIFGQGPATYFYSAGFHRMTLKTEWTYVEMLRNYGIMSFVILYILCRPIFSLFKLMKTSDVAIAMFLTYGIYLIIAGTNPLIFSSTGMIVFISFYNIVYQLEKEKSM